MSAARPLVRTALAGLALATLAAIALVLGVGGGLAHGPLALYAFLLPALAAFTVHATGSVLQRPVPARKVRLLSVLWLAGGTVLGLGFAYLPPGKAWLPTGVAGLLLLGASGMTAGTLLKALPRRGESVVAVARDPLTKGDDASVAHLRFAQFFLPLGVLLDLASQVRGGWMLPAFPGVHLAGVHLLAAHALVTCYGLAHLWVPRLSGVPAIAAGAIKGELHSTLLGLALLLAGFLLGARGLLIAGGAFLFLGAFTFMGVIGANIMRNKSKTQRVTREFTYIPWAFTAVFWLLSGVLLGIFLNVVPEAYAGRATSLRFTHVHIAFLGGVAQLLLALAWRLVPAARGAAPPPFQGLARLGYFALNAGLALLLVGHFQAGGEVYSGTPPAFLAGASLVVLGLAASFFILARHGRRPGEARRTT